MLNYDVVIVGSGIVGATTALALAKQTSLKIAIIEAKDVIGQPRNDEYDFRVSAISQASKKFFQTLSVWESIVKKRVSPYTKMFVWEEENKSEICFDAADVNESALGFIVEDSVVRSSLLDEITHQSNVDFLQPCHLVKINSLLPKVKLAEEKLELTLQWGSTKCINHLDHPTSLQTRLLIGADGANSTVRNLIGIKLKEFDYGHTALVSTVETSSSHQKTAWQRFLQTGPLAFLPLKNVNHSSIVWSTQHDQAQALLQLSDEAFCNELAKAFNYKLGDIKKVSKRYTFPLRMRHAEHYVKANIALLGDAAHTIHPLAGQGVNLGLLDAINLVSIIKNAIIKNRDFASFATLRQYERARKGDNCLMLTGVDILKKLFATKSTVLKEMRNTGMNMINRTQVIKNIITDYALGKR